MVVLGIDPGKHGALVALYEDNSVRLCPFPLVGSDPDLYELVGFVKSIVKDNKDIVCYIEKVSAMPKQGVTSMFNFGMVYGMALGVIASERIPLFKVRVNDWQRVMLGPFKKGESKKKALLVVKESYIPFWELLVKKEYNKQQREGLIDAFLIAHYGRIKQKNG